MKEPLWRTLLCWGAVLAYLTVPLITYILIVVSIQSPGWNINEHLKDFAGLGQWFQALSALVFGLAGLRSFDRYVDVKNGSKKKFFEPEEEPPKK